MSGGWLALVLLGTHGLAAVGGLLYEGCRRGGSVDLREELALLTEQPEEASR